MNVVDRLTLPEMPGVYIYSGKNKEILYIGKAKNLKRRVSSYFCGNHRNEKITNLILLVENIDYFVTKTADEALFLEDKLIKKHKPKYNIELKDDKTYPYLVITNEYLPRLVLSRNYGRNVQGERYGPYSLLSTVKVLTNIAKKIFYLRPCSINFSQESINKHKYKECLQYHIGNCKAPCVEFQSQEEYIKNVREFQEFLRGNIKRTLSYLRNKMYNHAKNFEFEKAQKIKEDIVMLKQYVTKNKVITNSDIIADVIFIINQDNIAYIGYFQFNKGVLLSSSFFKMKLSLGETNDQVLYSILQAMKIRNIPYAKKIILNFQPSFSIPQFQFFSPQKGYKAELLYFAEKNCQQYLQRETHKAKLLYKPEENKSLRILKVLKEVLSMNVLPLHIECFDNSNFHGSFPVSSCVVFKDGVPAKKEYRKYIVKTVEGIDDFSTMEEVVLRRYTRLLNEQKKLPDLIIVDGGKGQLFAAYKILQKLHIQDKLQIIGIAKREEEIFKIDHSNPICLPKNSDALKLIAQIRDEAHRFAITFHKQIRSKRSMNTELQQIKGLSEVSIIKILRHVKSIVAIKSLSLQELEEILPPKEAKVIFKYFNQSL